MRKLSSDGKMIDIAPHVATLRAFLPTRPGLIATYLYGSYGTAAQTPLSDVDLALIYDPAALPGFEEELAVIGHIVEILQEEDSSLTILNRAPLPFRFRVLQTGRLLFCADAVALADFVEDTIKRHGDYICDYRPFIAEYDAALLEHYGRG